MYGASAGFTGGALAQGGFETVAVPFAQAALWAADLPALKVCDLGINDGDCPARPEHGGAGFLSTVFTWRYVLNNLRGALAAIAAGDAGVGAVPPPNGANEATLQVLAAFDQLMEQPLIDVFGEVTQAARRLLEGVRPFLLAQPQFSLRIPQQSVVGPQHWAWPSDGRTPFSQAAFQLRTGARMPAVGFGTWRLWAKEAYQPVRWALEAGYRHIDTAEGYANEEQIGRALRDSGVPRSEVFLATKASSVPKGLADISLTGEVFNMQLAQLGTDYVDLYMLHTPPQDTAQLRIIWPLLETLYDQGRVRALGISNCDVNELKIILSFARIPPAYIQNLFKVYKPGEQMSSQDDIIGFAHSNQIAVMGYSVQTEWPHVMPPLQDPHILSIAAQLGRTPSQVLHRWALQRGVGVIPKSSSQARIVENAQLFDFELSRAAMRLIDGLATLSETGAPSLVKPSHQEDVFGLTRIGTASGIAAATPPIAVGQNVQHDAGSAELLERTRDQGFTFASIRDHLLGAATNLSPAACQQRCLEEPRCAAWEVCAPYDPRTGCDGCYLIGTTQLSTISIQGWHAGIERR